jgi:hypothetical protein
MSPNTERNYRNALAQAGRCKPASPRGCSGPPSTAGGDSTCTQVLRKFRNWRNVREQLHGTHILNRAGGVTSLIRCSRGKLDIR